MQQGGVLGNTQPAALLMPSGAVAYQQRVGRDRDLGADLLEVLIHRLGVGAGHDYRRAGTLGRTDRAEQIDGIVAVVAAHGRPAADRPLALPFHPASPDGTLGKSRPDILDRALLADPGLIPRVKPEGRLWNQTSIDSPAALAGSAVRAKSLKSF